MAKKKKDVNKKLPAPQISNSFEQEQQKYDDLVKQCLEIIEEQNILFITDLVAFLPFSRTTFYEYGLNKSEVLSDAINKQRIFTKQSLRSKFFNSNNPAERLALYKLICTEEERNAISNNPKPTENNLIEAPKIIHLDNLDDRRI